MLLVAALGVAGLVSAKNHIEKPFQRSSVNSAVKKVKKMNAVDEFTCVPTELSCGVKGWVCGSNTEKMLKSLLDIDNEIYGKK